MSQGKDLDSFNIKKRILWRHSRESGNPFGIEKNLSVTKKNGVYGASPGALSSVNNLLSFFTKSPNL